VLVGRVVATGVLVGRVVATGVLVGRTVGPAVAVLVVPVDTFSLPALLFQLYSVPQPTENSPILMF